MKMEVSIDVVALVIGAIVFIVGYAELKFISRQNKKDIEILWTKHDDLSVELRGALSKVSESLNRIEGRLNVERN